MQLKLFLCWWKPYQSVSIFIDYHNFNACFSLNVRSSQTLFDAMLHWFARCTVHVHPRERDWWQREITRRKVEPPITRKTAALALLLIFSLQCYYRPVSSRWLAGNASRAPFSDLRSNEHTDSHGDNSRAGVCFFSPFLFLPFFSENTRASDSRCTRSFP